MRTPLLEVTERAAVELMRDRSRHLVQMHNSRGGREWYLVPGGKIRNELAQALLARAEIQPSNDGLFPGISQTFQFRRST